MFRTVFQYISTYCLYSQGICLSTVRYAYLSQRDQHFCQRKQRHYYQHLRFGRCQPSKRMWVIFLLFQFVCVSNWGKSNAPPYFNGQIPILFYGQIPLVISTRPNTFARSVSGNRGIYIYILYFSAIPPLRGCGQCLFMLEC